MAILLLLIFSGLLATVPAPTARKLWDNVGSLELILVLIISLLLVALIHLLLRRPRELMRELDARARALSEAELSLARETAVRAAAEQEVRHSHALLDSAFEHMPAMVVLKRVSDLRVLRANRLSEQLLGLPPEVLQGHMLADLLPPEVSARFIASDLKAIHERTLVDLPEERIDLPDAGPRWLHIRKQVLNDTAGNPEYLLVLGEDITARKAAENRTLQLARTLEVLSATNQAIVHLHDSEQLVDRACEILVEKGGYPLAWIGLRDGSGKMRWAIHGQPRDFAQQAIELLCAGSKPCPASGQADRHPQPQFCANIDCCPPSVSVEGKRLGLTSLAVLPLIIAGAHVGSIGIFSSQSDLFDEREQQALTDLAHDLSHALEAIGLNGHAEKSLRQAAQVFESTSEVHHDHRC